MVRRSRTTGNHDGLHWLLAWLFCLLPGFALAQASLIAEYRFDDVAWCSPTQALDTTAGGHHGSLVGYVGWEDSPASGSKLVNGAAARFAGNGTIDITGLPLSTAPGAKTSVSFWMYWDGTNSVMPVGFGWHDLWIYGGSFGFNTFNSDIYGIASAGLANGWHHVAAVFTNGDVHSNELWIDGVKQTLTQLASTPYNPNAYVNPHMRLSGVWGTGGYQFSGVLDLVRIYNGALTQAQVDADRASTYPAIACPPPPPPVLVTHYRLDDNWDASHSTANDVAGGPLGVFLSPYASKVAAPAVPPNKPDTCSGAQFTNGKGSMRSTGNALDTNVGGKNSVTFWMYWQGGNNQMPFGFHRYDLWLVNGHFGFNTSNSDIFGIASTGLANGWHHVAAVFTNGNVHANKLWIDGVPQVLTQRQSSPANTYAFASGTFQLSSWSYDNNYRFNGILDEVKVYRGALNDTLVQQDMTASCHTLLAEWRMDEASWNGSSTGEVKDSSGNGYHGTVGGLSSSYPTTDGTSPAIAGSPGTCRYGVFDRTKKQYVELPGFPDLGINGSFTITAWIRTSNNTQSGQRILIDDQNNSYGYGFSLGDGGTGKLRFYSRGTPSALILDTPNVIANNTWYFVAAVADVPNKTKHIYAFDAAGTQLAYVNKAWTEASFGADPGPASIGGETNASGENSSSFGFGGNIDEVRVYGGALGAVELNTVRQLTRPCAALHHLALEHPTGQGLTCAANMLTIKACADAPCTNLYTGGVTGTLTASGPVNWDGGAGFTIPAGSGSVTKNVQIPNAGTVSFGVSGASPSPATSATCSFGSPACTFTVATAGFVFSNSSTGSSYNIPAQTSGVSFGGPGSLYLRAVQASTTNPAECTPAIKNQTISVNMGYVCNDPSACQSGNLVTIDTTPIAPGGTPVMLSFDNDGSAAITARYDDVGRITLNASKTITPFGGATPVTLTGSSNDFVVKPDHFELDNINCSDGTANPAASGPSGAKFCRAGENFSVIVRAKNALGNRTKNFGQETSPESVKLTSTLFTSPDLTNNPQPSGSFNAFTSGEASGNFSWGEVGIITLTPSILDGDYLGAGDVSGTASSNVGRFYPHHFDTTVGNACGSFTYSSQPFPLRITAKNAGGGTTMNYAGSFAKNGTLSDANGASGTFSPSVIAAVDFSGGIANASMSPNVSFTFANKLSAPATLKVRVNDGEADSSSGSEGTTLLRSGRMRLSNTFGAHSPLAMPIEAQYWSGASWVKNADDNCTSLTGIFSAPPDGWSWPAAGSDPALAGGTGKLMITGPVSGTATVTASGVPAWLKSRWNDSANYDQPPSAQVTIGVQAPETKRTVHVREVH